MTGENVGIQLGPYNSKYPGLVYQMQQCHFVYDPEDCGRWYSFLNLESENGKLPKKGSNFFRI
jgi:hypothetical protein